VGVLADLTNLQFGWLRVLHRSTNVHEHRLASWDCQCEKCGTILTVRSDALRNGTVTSCRGCRHDFQVHALFQEFYDGSKQ
jgi:hypothetical protein